jgi:hypothetical protein
MGYPRLSVYKEDNRIIIIIIIHVPQQAKAYRHSNMSIYNLAIHITQPS